MAQKIVAEVVLDAGESIKELQLVEQQLKNIEDELKVIGASGTGDFEQQLKDLNAVVKNSTLTWGEYGKAIEQYQNIALAAGQTSPIGKAALEQAAILKDQMDDVSASVNNLAMDSRNLQTALQLGSGITAGYTAFQSVTALVGVENEKLMETMVKLQAAQSALVSIEQIRATLEKQSLVTLKAKDFWNKAVAFSTQLFAKAQTGATTATAGATVGVRAFTAALIATGIGAIIVGIGMLIAYFDQVKAAVVVAVEWLNELRYKFQDLGIGIKIALAVLFPFVGVIWAAIEALEYFGVIDDKQTAELKKNVAARVKNIEAERDALIAAKQAEMKALQERYDEEEAARVHALNVARALGKDTEQMERDQLKAKQENILAQIALLEEQIKAERRAAVEILKAKALVDEIQAANLALLQKLGGEEAFINAAIANDESIAKLRADLDKTEKDIEVFEAKVTKKKADAAKQRNDATQKELDNEAEMRRKAAEDEYQALLDRYAKEEEAAEAYRQRQLTERQKAEDDLRTRLYNELELAGENNELKLLLEEEFQKNMKAIDDDYRNQAIQAEKDKIQAENDARREQLDQQLSMTSTYFQGVSALADAFSKGDEKRQRVAFKIKKAADLAAATIDGTRAVLNAFATTPAPLNVGAAIAAGAFAAANIAKIAQTQFEGGATSDITPSVPSINESIGGVNGGGDNLGNNTTTDPLSLLNGGGMQPVLVVDSFTAVQNDLNKVTAMGTLG
jgi:hypothetical protein